MAFLETPRFPECISIKAVMRPTYKTTIVALASGYKKKNREWSEGLHTFDFSHNALIEAEHLELRTFFHAIGGMDGEFRVKDYTDYYTTISDGVLLPVEDGRIPATGGTGYGSQVYVAAKAYVSGARVSYRLLQKLVQGTHTVYRGGSPVTVGVSAGNIALDYTTGQITFVADQSRGIATHAVGATHVLTLTSALSPNIAIGERIYVVGVAGTAATTLNGFSHLVTNVAGAVVTIATNTTGLTATNATGNADFYAQSSATLTIVTEFDTPCMFSSDSAEIEVIAKQATLALVYAWSGINLEEVRIPL